MLKKLILAFCVILVISCKKENPKPQWDIEIYGPVLHATLGVSELIGDSSITTIFDGAQVIDYDTTFSDFEIDSIYQINDTTITTLYVFPPFPTTISQGSAFPSPNNDLTLGLGSLQLKKAIILEGKIRIEIKNTLPAKINYTYDIPKAKKNGVAFSVTTSIDSASVSSPKYFIGEYDISGYEIDLTGFTGNLVNTIYYNVVASSQKTFSIQGGETMIDLKSTLLGIKPSFVLGYLGQENSRSVTTENIGIGGLIKNGTVLLDSVTMNIDLKNYIGADAQGLMYRMSSINNRTGNTVDLVSSSFINHSLNINRASINSSLQDSLVPTTYPILLDNSNSNIRNFIENIPDKLDYDLGLNLNPLGNVSGSNDFVFSDRLFETHLRIRMPLNFALDQLVLADTVPFSISNATDFDPVGPMNLKLVAYNGFPIDMNIMIFLLDTSDQHVTDSLIVPDLIAAAPYDANYKATGTTRTEINIPVDAARKEKLLSVKNVALRMKFDTPDYPQKIQLYSSYKLDLKLIADGIYSIR